jgi:hypothetical protein
MKLPSQLLFIVFTGRMHSPFNTSTATAAEFIWWDVEYVCESQIKALALHLLINECTACHLRKSQALCVS